MSTPTNDFIEAIADKIAARIQANLATNQPPAQDLDIPYPVTLICQQLGRRNRRMAYQTFQKNYLDTNLLNLIDNPHDRRNRYVRLGDWLQLRSQTR